MPAYGSRSGGGDREMAATSYVLVGSRELGCGAFLQVIGSEQLSRAGWNGWPSKFSHTAAHVSGPTALQLQSPAQETRVAGNL